MPYNGEFDIIRRYFSASTRQPRRDVLLSVGDDCAITEIKPNRRLALTTDTLVEGTHFLPSISAADLAYKAVAEWLGVCARRHRAGRILLAPGAPPRGRAPGRHGRDLRRRSHRATPMPPIRPGGVLAPQ